MIFRDRKDAGRRLAAALEAYGGRDDVGVLGLPRGGLLVAEEIARRLGAPLDVFVVSKLGVPGYEELAMGALASGGVRMLNEDVIRRLGISPAIVDEAASKGQRELERREREYRRGWGPVDVSGKTIILVDDGLATGATMRAAVTTLRQRGTGVIVAAVPVGPADTCCELNRVADDVVCLVTPEPFLGVRMWYQNFTPATDDDVAQALDRTANHRQIAHVGARRRPQREAGDAIRSLAVPVSAADADYDVLLDAVGDRRLVLLGEASHGTHDFYAVRAEITRRLIETKGFHAIAADADWPDAYRVNRFVRGQSEDTEAIDCLSGFHRFPSWMWRNADVLDFVGWLREHNDDLPAGAARVGFYGLDLYRLYGSIDAALEFLDRVDPEAARRTRQRCSFDHVLDSARRDAVGGGVGLRRECQDGAIQKLQELLKHTAEYQASAPLADEERFFFEQNARVVKNAPIYYQSMFARRDQLWNLRDRHMFEMLEALMALLDRRVGRSKIVVWAHNAHLGDARATEMGERGELNIGQLVRQHYDTDALLLGFTTHSGTVTAASEWGAPAERKAVRRALPASYEALLHETGLARFLVDLRRTDPAVDQLRRRRLERTIGATYLPESERTSHYYYVELARQFDYLIHIDQTSAVEPLEQSVQWTASELSQTA